MTIKKQLKHYVGRKNTRRIYNALPWVSGAVALAALNSAAGRRILTNLQQRAVEALPARETPVDRPA
jgi:hypothetical protein